MQNTRNRQNPPHRFLLYIVLPPTPSCHSLCLPQPFFWALSMFPSLFLSITIVRTAAARKCPRNYFMLKKHQLNVSIWNLQEHYWQGNVAPLPACLLFHLLRQVVWWDTAELAAWLLVQCENWQTQKSSPQLKWKSVWIGFGIFGSGGHGIWPASMSIF